MTVTIDIRTGKVVVENDTEDDGYVTVHPSVYRQPGEGRPTAAQEESGVYDQPGARIRR